MGNNDSAMSNAINKFALFLTASSVVIMIINFIKNSMLTADSKLFAAANVCIGLSIICTAFAFLAEKVFRYNSVFVYYIALSINLSNYTTVLIYSSDSDNVPIGKIILTSLIFWGSFIVMKLSLPTLLSVMNNTKLKKFILPAFISLCLAFSVFCIVAADRESGTMTVLNVQMNLFFFITTIFLYAIFCDERNSSIIRGYSIFTVAASFMCLFAAKETGVPILSAAAIILFNIFFNHRRKYLFYISLIAAIVGAAAFAGLYIYGSTLDGDVQGIVQAAADKVYTRVHETDQGGRALELIANSSLLSNPNYMFLFASSNEFLFSAEIHYAGVLSVSFMLVLMIMCLWTYKCRDKNMNHFFWSVKNLSFVMFAVITLYNWLMCLGILPMIGINSLFSGSLSLSNSVLSGFLGAILIVSEEDSEIAADSVNDILKFVKSSFLFGKNNKIVERW